MTSPSAHFTIVTADAPGPVGIIQIHGPRAAHVVQQLVGFPPTPIACLADLAQIDEGIVAALRDDWCQITPHGGPRVIQRLAQKLQQLGAAPAHHTPAPQLYPEADSPLEADALDALARAASPAAIDLLLDQPRRWAHAITTQALDPAAILEHTHALNRLIDPPSVAIVGQANVGKSTLTNAIMGRATSVTADLPGTTRDWVGGLAQLTTPAGHVAVRWLDTPGLRATHDHVERVAIELAQHMIQSADALIALRDPQLDWPEPSDLPRQPDLWVLNKADLDQPAPSRPSAANHPASAPPGADPANPLPISALHDRGLNDLAQQIAAVLGLTPSRLARDVPWAFSPFLRHTLAGGDTDVLSRYIQSIR